MAIAARYLATRPRTRWEVERRLKRAGVGDVPLIATLDNLTTLGYLDDQAFVSWWAEQRDRHAPRGRRMIEAELRQHGVPAALLASLRGDELSIPGPDSEALPTDEQQRATLALRRHLGGRQPPDDRRELQRLSAFLLRRGFSGETVRAALRNVGGLEVEDA